jgi:hypothetical protein
MVKRIHAVYTQVGTINLYICQKHHYLILPFLSCQYVVVFGSKYAHCNWETDLEYCHALSDRRRVLD